MVSLFVLLVWVLAGCGGDVTPRGEPAPQILTGHAVFGHEVREFRPCGADSALWAVDPSGLLWDLHHEFVPTTTPYARLFAVVEGHRGPAPADGFGADYPGVLEISRVLYCGAEGPDCNLDWTGFEYRALGNEPGWLVEITGDGLRLTRPGAPDLHWPDVTRTVSGKTVRLVGAGGPAGKTVELVITPEPGRDSMSGSYFSLGATFRYEGRTYRGRALAGAAPGGS